MAANPAVPVPLLSLEVQKTPTENIVRCSGKITSATNEQLQSTVRGLAPEKKRIVLDLTNTSFIDSSGLGALVGLYVSCRHAGSRLKLINLTPRLKDLFAMTNLAPIFEGHDDLLGHTPD
ncbi:MAG: STAS domain-containing protein [Acidobacteriia bacterium]|nr:STAS domain-containing protein [Terriglobia bacterium]